MRLLDRHLLREFLHAAAFCLGGFCVAWIVFLLVTELDEFHRAKLSAFEVVQFLFVTSPGWLGHALPFGLLLAMLHALGQHARHNEITAIRAAGVSLWRIAVPYLAVGALGSVLLLALNEWWLPDAADRGTALMNRHSGSTASTGWRANVHFVNEPARRTWLIGEFNEATGEMRRPIVEWRGDSGAITNLSAARATWNGEQWTFHDAQLTAFTSLTQFGASPRAAALVIPEFTETPRLIRSEIKISSLTAARRAKGASLSLAEILEYQRLHPDRRDDPALNTRFHSRLAGHASCLLVVLIALPFAAVGGRRNVFVGVASSIFIGFAYFILQRLGEALGIGGHVPAVLAGWMPNLLFASIGAVLIARVR